MAKTFKKETTTENPPAKATSERDFFDFLEESLTERPVGSAGRELGEVVPDVAESVLTGNTGKPVTTGNTPTTQAPADLPGTPAPDAEPNREAVVKPVAPPQRHRAIAKQPSQLRGEPNDKAAFPLVPVPAAEATSAPIVPAVSSQGIRQTFVVGAQFLEQLLNFVHAQRAAGAYWYSQRQALEEALALLFAAHSPVTQRPEHIQAREQERRVRIQQGRRAAQKPKDPPSST